MPPSGSATSNGLMRGVSGSGELHAAARPWARGGVTTRARSASASVPGEAASGTKGFEPAFASNGLARVEDGSGTGAAEARTPGGVDATCPQLRGVKRRCAQQSERGGGINATDDGASEAASEAGVPGGGGVPGDESATTHSVQTRAGFETPNFGRASRCEEHEPE